MSRAASVAEVVARALADRPEQVSVVESAHRGVALVEVFMNSRDLGRVIGRQGRTAQAIRTLVAAAAELDGQKAQLEFRDAPEPRG